jgi:hypothetical protein
MMNIYAKLSRCIALSFSAMWLVAGSVFAQPANDNCASAEEIVITGGGYDLGVFTSTQVTATLATLQSGEYLHPAQFAANKSMWFRFTIPTHRQVRILLAQPVGGTLSPQDAGWTLYRANTSDCLPSDAFVIEPSIPNIEGFTHDCLRPGTYLIQVTMNSVVNQPLFVELTMNHPSAVETQYDFASRAYNFGTLSGGGPPATWFTNYDVGCQSIHSTEGTCPLPNYTQSTWHVFRTDAHPDLVRFEVSQASPWDGVARSWGYVLHQGDARLDSIADGVPAGGQNLTTIQPCTTITQTSVNATTAGAAASVVHHCQLLPNTTYSIQLFHPSTYSRNIRVQLHEVGGPASISGNPTAIAPARRLGVLPGGATATTDRYSCVGNLSNYTATCPQLTGPDGYYVNGGDTMDVQQLITFELNETTNVRFRVTNQLYVSTPTPLVRLYRGDVMDDDCAGLTFDRSWRNNDQLVRCLPAGKYTLQMLGRTNRQRAHQSGLSSLGRIQTMTMTVGQEYSTQFGLRADGEYDQINGGAPLVTNVRYNATADTFDC